MNIENTLRELGVSWKAAEGEVSVASSTAPIIGWWHCAELDNIV